MNHLMKHLKDPLLITMILLYIISPFDFIPDSIPFWGWLDDGALLGLLIYYLWWGKLPDFSSWWRRSSGTEPQRHRRPERSRGFKKRMR